MKPDYLIRRHDRLTEHGEPIPGSTIYELWAEYPFQVQKQQELLASTNTFDSIIEEKKDHIRNAKVAELNKQKSDLLLIIDDFVEMTKDYMNASRLDKEVLTDRRNTQAQELLQGTERYLDNLSKVGVVHEQD